MPSELFGTFPLPHSTFHLVCTVYCIFNTNRTRRNKVMRKVTVAVPSLTYLQYGLYEFLLFRTFSVLLHNSIVIIIVHGLPLSFIFCNLP